MQKQLKRMAKKDWRKKKRKCKETVLYENQMVLDIRENEYIVVSRDGKNYEVEFIFWEEDKVNKHLMEKGKFSIEEEDIPKDGKFKYLITIFFGIAIMIAAKLKDVNIYFFTLAIEALLVGAMTQAAMLNRTSTLSGLWKHTAMHKMINFFNHKHRLPENLAELENTTRLNLDCIFSKNIINLSGQVLPILIATLIAKSIPTENILYNIACQLLIYIGLRFCIKIKFIANIENCIGKIVALLIQIAILPEHTSQVDLLMAYVLMKYWVNITDESDYNSENKEYLDKFIIITYKR